MDTELTLANEQTPSLLENFIPSSKDIEKERMYFRAGLRKFQIRLCLSGGLFLLISWLTANISGLSGINFALVLLLGLVVVFVMDSLSFFATKNALSGFCQLTLDQAEELNRLIEIDEVKKFVACINRKDREPVQYELDDIRQWLKDNQHADEKNNEAKSD